jgi:pyruvate/2-oxoacid:ferredoxin oxidoreductase alpha subunit/NAD-dependent dihydropyrimidine dehydrogenase PreA subunit
MKSGNKYITTNMPNWKQQLLKLEISICDGLQWPDLLPGDTNIFGRKISISPDDSLSYINGLTLSGLRTSSLVDSSKLANCSNQIHSAATQHLPLTLHVNRSDRRVFGRITTNPEILPFQDIVQFISSNSQEVLDFSLIAHKISEAALTPVIHQISTFGNGEADSLSKTNLVAYAGSAEDLVEVSTPSQNMIFGEKRRRIPQWFNYDLPAQMGALKDQRGLELEHAARKAYFQDHLELIISDSFERFESLTGRKYRPIYSYKAQDAQFLLITVGTNPDDTRIVIDELRANKIKIGFLNINMINPFPSSLIERLIMDKKAVTILEPISRNSKWLISRIKQSIFNVRNKPTVISGYYNNQLSVNDILAAGTNMNSSNPKGDYYCGVEFTRATSKYPKYQVMLQEIERNYPDLKNIKLDPPNSSEPTEILHQDHKLSNVSRQYKDLGPPFTRLSRFQDSTMLFYENNRSKEMVADPFQSISSVPAASASLGSMAGVREKIPLIDPVKCSACGSCMVQCPHSAMPSGAVSIENLIQTGMDRASATGLQIIGLLPMVTNLSKASARIISGLDEAERINSLKDILNPAFENLATQMKLDGEKLETIQKEFQAVADALQDMPVIISEALYYGPESQNKGTGELFMLAIDPNTCTGCSLCQEVCEEEAIDLIPERQEDQINLQKRMELWESLPDTSADTINRLLFDKDYDSFAALMLSRNFYLNQAGASSEDRDISSKQLIHLISAMVESLIQPKYSDFVNKIEGLVSDLSENIHSILSESLPKENFDNIAKAISQVSDEKVPFDEIISNISKEDRLKQIDSGEVKRKIELLDSLRGLKWYLLNGPTGVGRSRFGVTLSGEDRFQWANRYPNNPFNSPIVITGNEHSAELISGVLEGQLRSIIDNIKLLRKAKLEIKNKYVPKEHDKEIASLDWDTISAEEIGMVPPILLIGDPNILRKNSIESISNLLSTNKPVKIFVIDDLSSAPHEVQSNASADIISLLSLKKAYLLQASMADSQFLFDGLIEGISLPSSALFHLFCPIPDRHNINKNQWSRLNSLALSSRAFPNFKFNPLKYKGFLNECISVKENPSPDEAWCRESLMYTNGSESEEVTFEVTWADWAYTLKDWESHFTDYEESNGKSLSVSEFISSENSDAVPVIYRIKDEKVICYAVSEEVVTQTRIVKESWNLLRELSGTIIPYPKELKKQVKEEVQEDFDQELERIKSEFEIKLKESEKVQVAAIRKKLRDKLVELTNKSK